MSGLDDARALLVATAGDRLAALWRLAIVTGFRQAELLGLGWDDVDLEAGSIALTAQLARDGDAWIRVPPKADRAVGRVSIDDATVAALRAHQRRQGAERQPDWEYWGMLFVTPQGLPIGRSDALRAFHAACDSAGIRRRRFHDMRASSARLLLELGVSEEVRMARLGHATKAMARHYSGASEVLDREAVRKLAAALA